MRTDMAIRKTKNYEMFVVHEFNRDLRRATLSAIEKSMLREGFRKSDAIHVCKHGKNKFKILRGHHRFAVAKKLGLEIYFIVDIEIDISQDEKIFNPRWSITEHVKAYVNQGRKHYIALWDFSQRNEMPISTSAFLLSGYANKVGAVTERLRAGTFEIDDKCLAFANQVTAIVRKCCEQGMAFAKTRAFITAIAALCRTDEFDSVHFLRRVEVDGRRIANRNSRDDFLEEIESLYNYRLRGEYVPVRGLAIAKVGKIEK